MVAGSWLSVAGARIEPALPDNQELTTDNHHAN
jgi:hypothetical protein